jgi:hypothetical protein
MPHGRHLKDMHHSSFERASGDLPTKIQTQLKRKAEFRPDGAAPHLPAPAILEATAGCAQR